MANAVLGVILHPAVLIALIALAGYAVYLSSYPTPRQVEDAVRASGLQNFLDRKTPVLTLRFDSRESWNTHPIARVRRVVLVPGTIAACVTDADSGLDYCVDICPAGVLVTRSLFGIKSVAAPAECEESTRAAWIERMTSLLRFALAHVNASRGTASRRYRVGGPYATISSAPLIAPSIRRLAQELYVDPLAVRSWLLLVIKDQYPAWARGRTTVDEPWADDLGPAIQFRVGRRGTVAKFGVTRYDIDDYGENANERVTYEVVQVEYDERARAWTRPEVILQEADIPDDLDAVVETGRNFRTKLYIVGLAVAGLLALILLRRLYKMVPEREKKPRLAKPEGDASGPPTPPAAAAPAIAASPSHTGAPDAGKPQKPDIAGV